MRVVFLHGTGVHGPAAWPRQVPELPEAVFLERVHPGDHPDAVVPSLVQALAPRAHLVSHSYGGLSALRLAAARPELVTSLVLCEPPAIVLTRGRPRTERHLADLRPIFERRDGTGVSDLELAAGFSAAVGMPVPDFTAEQLARAAARLRAFTPAWQIEVDASVVAQVPTLVVTSGADDFYDEIAAVLAHHGAQRLVLTGQGHRVQDHPEATAAFRRFWADHRAPDG